VNARDDIVAVFFTSLPQVARMKPQCHNTRIHPTAGARDGVIAALAHTFPPPRVRFEEPTASLADLKGLRQPNRLTIALTGLAHPSGRYRH
jgi:hypothetical protein